VKPITIIGGGLAGLTLGIGLRRQGIRARVWEAGHYPRHRVCGEFVSGRGLDVLERLGLAAEFRRAGAILSKTAAFFAGGANSPARSVRPAALCLSRFTMDQVLAERFQALGGELFQNKRWEEENAVEGVVLASGRRLKSVEGGWRWLGLKIHARDVELSADLEMHASANGYVGLCRLPGEEVNVCGLFRIRPEAHLSRVAAKALIRGAPGTSLAKRLEGANCQEDSFCSVTGLSLQPQRAEACEECRLGDALTMIPPITGNGMSMAFEAAEIALGPLAEYAGGQMTWAVARNTIARICDRRFRQRLFWARLLHGLMFSQTLQRRAGTVLLRSGLVWRWMFERTR
jgi:2-polyprenyl-6-methoxyphenol hydroxylase-like FAD-dependent oxidoreductase